MSKKRSLSKLFGAATAVLTGVGLSAAPVHRADAETFQQWLNQPTMTGDWGGVRTNLANSGLDFHAIYLGQLGNDVSGGKRTGTDYAQQVTAGVDINLQKLFGGPPGGIVHLYVEDRAGRPLSTDYTGTTILDNGVYGSGENFRLLEMAYEQNTYNKRLNFLVGYYVLSTEFAFSPLLCGSNFLSNGFCGHPQFLGQDTGYQLGPIADWGGRIRYFPTPALSIAFGAFEVNPAYTHGDKGFDLNFEHATGAMLPIEIGYTTSLGPDKLIGHYKVGGIYDTSKNADNNAPTTNVYGRYAGWLMVDQMVWKAAASSVTLFAEAGIADKRTSIESDWLEGGFVYKGILPFRPNDNLNFGYIHATTNPERLNHEEAVLAKAHMSSFDLQPNQQLVELGYNIAVAKWFGLTPDVQYFWNPGSTTYKHYDNVTVVSLQAKIVF